MFTRNAIYHSSFATNRTVIYFFYINVNIELWTPVFFFFLIEWSNLDTQKLGWFWRNEKQKFHNFFNIFIDQKEQKSGKKCFQFIKYLLKLVYNIVIINKIIAQWIFRFPFRTFWIIYHRVSFHQGGKFSY